MGYLVVKKTKIGGEVKVTSYTSDDIVEAKRLYHSTLAQAYGKDKDTLEHILCTLEDDTGMQLLMETYFAPKKPVVEPEVVAE